MKLAFVATVRLPTEKAHGYQIVKMCEAFAANGANVSLLHPFRRQFDPTMNGRSVFDYYGTSETFDVRTLPNVDVFGLSRVLPGKLFTAVRLAFGVKWGLAAVRQARKENAEIHLTRDIDIAYWLTRRGMPTVLELHSVPKRARKWLLRRVAGAESLRLVVVITAHIKERIVDLGFEAEKVVVLPDAVDPALFERLPGRRESRRRVGLPEDRPIVGYVGQFQTLGIEKGIEELVEAVSRQPKINGKAPMLVCVGGAKGAVNPYLELASRLGMGLDRLRFVDRVPNYEVPLWIRACDLVTIPFPRTEHYAYFASPLKLFEYMAADTPILATDLPSIREVLRQGENGWLVEPGNAEALADGIRLLLDSPGLRRKLATAARRDVRQNTWGRRAAKVLEALQAAPQARTPA